MGKYTQKLMLHVYLTQILIYEQIVRTEKKSELSLMTSFFFCFVKMSTRNFVKNAPEN